ncbi:MAG: hypothetical protein JWM68_4043 [Verrucomicrobiales bacterium]|nr:hypothetical protein [Verrucomicrobiales bacterium]
MGLMRGSPSARALTVFFILALFRLAAEPANIMVGDLTFTRPASWRWEAPQPHSKAVNGFVIPDAASKSKVDVTFYIVNNDIPTQRGILRSRFPEAQEADMHEQWLTIGKQKILYFQIVGTFIYKEKAQPDQFWFEAVIPQGKAYVYAQIHGPRVAAERELGTFKKMVEDAIRTREAEKAAE